MTAREEKIARNRPLLDECLGIEGRRAFRAHSLSVNAVVALLKEEL
jgi:hypothetical protein